VFYRNLLDIAESGFDEMMRMKFPSFHSRFFRQTSGSSSSGSRGQLATGLFVCFFGESDIEPRPPEPLRSTEVPYDTGAIPQINDEFVLENCVCLIDMATPHLHGINAVNLSTQLVFQRHCHGDDCMHMVAGF
jgi:hypothetical protein